MDVGLRINKKTKRNHDTNFIRLWKFFQSLFASETRILYGPDHEVVEDLIGDLERRYERLRKGGRTGSTGPG